MVDGNKTVVCVDNISAYEAYPSDILNNGLILTLDISVTARAKRDKRNILQVSDLLTDHNLFFLAKESFESSKNISSKLSKSMPEIGFDLTGIILYPIKITLDTILLHSKLIQEVGNVVKPSSIIGLVPPEVKYSNWLLIDGSFPLLSYIAKNLSESGKISASFVPCVLEKTNLNSGASFSFGQPSWKSISFFLLPAITKIHDLIELNFLLIVSFLLSFKLGKKPRTLSIGSRDVNTVSTISKYVRFPNLLKINSKFLLKTNPSQLRSSIPSEFNVEVEHVNIQPFITQMANILSFNKQRIKLRFSFILLIIKFFKPNLIVVQTGSIFNLLSMFALEASKHSNIKAFCWMHGGYGAYTSMPGYDVTDFYSFSGHLVYGKGAQDTISSKNSILRKLYPKRIYETHILGSPFIEKTYENTKNSAFDRKKIVFVLPGAYPRNAYYIGYDRENEFLNYKECIISILQILKKHSSKFDIIVKDYPSGFYKELVIPDFQSIQYISHEIDFVDCVSNAGALIFPWISTSFIEGVLTDANIFLFDPSTMNQASVPVLKTGCFLFRTDLQEFAKKLDQSLNNIDKELGFSRANNQILRSYFIESAELCSDNYSKVFEMRQ